MLPSLQKGWTGREVIAGGDQGTPPNTHTHTHTHTHTPPSASPGQVARRAGTLVVGSAAAMVASADDPGAASAAEPPPLGSGSGSAGVALPASGCSGLLCSVELPAPMACLRFSRAQQPGYAFPK